MSIVVGHHGHVEAERRQRLSQPDAGMPRTIDTEIEPAIGLEAARQISKSSFRVRNVGEDSVARHEIEVPTKHIAQTTVGEIGHLKANAA